MRIAFLSFFILLLLSMVIDWAIYLDLRRFLKNQKWCRWYAISSIVCWVYLIVFYLLPKRELEDDILYQMWMVFAYITVYAAKAVYLIFSLIGKLPRLWKKQSVALGLWVGVPLGVLVCGSLWYGALKTRYDIEVVDCTVFSPRLPAAFNGYRIVQFSDIHVGTWGNDTTFISRLVDTINAQKPDVIFFTGDAVNRKTMELKPFLPVLSRLRAKDGVYSILGNHDYGDYIDWPNEALHLANNRQLVSWQRRMGWKLLNNTHTFLFRDRGLRDSVAHDSIVLIGVENWGEPPFRQYGDLAKAYPSHPDSLFNINDNRFKILLTHNPEHWRRVTSAITNIDLSLAGHTHAMQVELRLGRFRWSPSEWVYKLWGGLYKTLNKDNEIVQLYVNIGSGEVGMPFRIGATPEVTVITLTDAPDPDPTVSYVRKPGDYEKYVEEYSLLRDAPRAR